MKTNLKGEGGEIRAKLIFDKFHYTHVSLG